MGVGRAGTIEVLEPWLQVISGQQLPKVDQTKERAIIDPLVRVEIFGIRPDTSRQETSYVENNGEGWVVLRGGGRSMTVTLLSSCPPLSIVHVTSLPPRTSTGGSVEHDKESGLGCLGSESWTLTYKLQ